MQMQDEQLLNQQPDTQEEEPKPEKEKKKPFFQELLSWIFIVPIRNRWHLNCRV